MLLGLAVGWQAYKSPCGARISVCIRMETICYWSANVHSYVISGSAVDLFAIRMHTSAHHRRDGTQTFKDVYYEWKRRNPLQRSGNKRHAVLADWRLRAPLTSLHQTMRARRWKRLHP